MTDLTLNCEFCKKPFLIKPKRLNGRRKNGQKFFCCSRKCRDLHHLSLKIETIICPECGNNFTRNKNLKRLKKCCSQLCAAKFSQKFVNPLNISKGVKKYNSTEEGKQKRKLQGERLRKYKICPQCKNKFYGFKKYCSKKCIIFSLPYRNNKISITRKRMFAEGTLNVTGGTTKWLIYNDKKVQGSYEYRACIILDKLKSLNLIKDWKKSNFRIKYIGEDTKQHSYLIDFELFTKSGRILYIETKGYIKPNDLLKWQAMKNQNYKLLVWKINHLQQIEQKLKI